MNQINFKNAENGLCVACDRPITISSFKMTCSVECHEKLIEFLEREYGVFKKVVDMETNIAYKVPTRDIVENGLNYENLKNYPIWK